MALGAERPRGRKWVSKRWLRKRWLSKRWWAEGSRYMHSRQKVSSHAYAPSYACLTIRIHPPGSDTTHRVGRTAGPGLAPTASKQSLSRLLHGLISLSDATASLGVDQQRSQRRERHEPWATFLAMSPLLLLLLVLHQVVFSLALFPFFPFPASALPSPHPHQHPTPHSPSHSAHSAHSARPSFHLPPTYRL